MGQAGGKMKLPSGVTGFLLLAGALAGPLFVASFLVQGALLPGYDPLRHPVSALSLGPHGWVQSLSFFLAGAMSVAFVLGARRVLTASGGWPAFGLICLLAWGVGLIASGMFATDPIGGYPVGTPERPDARSFPGVLHNLAAVVQFLALIVCCAAFGRWFAARRQTVWAYYSFASAVALLVSIVLASYGLGRIEGLGQFAGLFQRIAGVIAFAWQTALAVHLLTRMRPD